MIDTPPIEAQPPYRVLVCDDAPVIRQAVQQALRNNSEFQVVEVATGGREAIAKALKLKPHLVLMDVYMPDLNGVEATRQILCAAPGTKVLAYSSDSAWATVEHMFAAGADGYVVKGADVDELLRAARTVLAGGHYLSVVLLESSDGATEGN